MGLCLKCSKEKYIKARGLCSSCYRKHATEFTKTTRTWTSSDIAILERHYKPLDPPEPLETKIIAKMLKCRNSDIRLLAIRSGLMDPAKIKKLDNFCRVRVQGFYRQGYSDKHIGRNDGGSRSTVQRWRKRMGLPANGRKDHSEAEYSKSATDAIRKRRAELIDFMKEEGL